MTPPNTAEAIFITAAGGPEVLQLRRSEVRAPADDEKSFIAAELLRDLWPLIEARRVRPVVHAVLPLSEVAQAHRLLEQGQLIGKVVLSTGPRTAKA